MWSLQFPLYAVGLGRQWTRKKRRRRRRRRRMVMRTKNAFTKDCAVLEAGILRKQISVDKEIAALGEGVILVWILTWM
jgi:uncharacterized membrane protein